MTVIPEGQLTFAFPATWRVIKFDEWGFYKNRFQYVCSGTKAVDFVALDRNGACWKIEVKDYRQHRRSKVIGLAEEVAQKARDTLAALAAAKVNSDDEDEKSIAAEALDCDRLRVVLHLEQPAKHSKLFPRAIDPADVLQDLRRLVKAIDAHPKVVEMSRMCRLEWGVQ